MIKINIIEQKLLKVYEVIYFSQNTSFAFLEIVFSDKIDEVMVVEEYGANYIIVHGKDGGYISFEFINLKDRDLFCFQKTKYGIRFSFLKHKK